MRTGIWVAGVTAILTVGCGQQQANEQNDTLVSANVPGVVENPNPAASTVLRASVSGDQAKKLMHDRHEGMEDIGDAFKASARWAKSDNPNVADVREDAAIISRLAPLASGWFPAGTGPDVGKTRAKAEIWQRPDDFAAKMKAFQSEAQKFNAAAQGADSAAAIAAHGELGKTCKACHDDYRAPEDEHGKN